MWWCTPSPAKYFSSLPIDLMRQRRRPAQRGALAARPGPRRLVEPVSARVQEREVGVALEVTDKPRRLLGARSPRTLPWWWVTRRLLAYASVALR